MGIFSLCTPKKSRDVGHERKLIIFSSMSDGGDGDFNELSWGHFYYKYVNVGYVESRVILLLRKVREHNITIFLLHQQYKILLLIFLNFIFFLLFNLYLYLIC